MSKSLYDQIKESAGRYPDRTAVVFYGKKYRYRKILSLVDNAAAGLEEAGVQKGSVVTLCLPNTPSALIAVYALNRIGAIVNLVHPRIPFGQLKDAIEKTKSSLLITYDLYMNKCPFQEIFNVPVLVSGSGYFMGGSAQFFYVLSHKGALKRGSFEELFSRRGDGKPAVPFGPSDPAVYLPSGGTSGEPKTIVHSCSAFNELCSRAAHFLSEDIKLYHSMLTVLPIFHGFGLCMNMHMCVTVGLTNVMCLKFMPDDVAKLIQKEKINIITGVPTMFTKLLECKRFNSANLSSLKDCFVGGDAVQKKLVTEFNEALKRGGSKARLHVGYGLAETVAACVINNRRAEKADSVGRPLPNTEIKILNDGREAAIGEIHIKSSLCMLGYLPDSNGGNDAEDAPFIEIKGEKWLKTGDLGYLCAEGFLFFKQRTKNLIKVSGVPVFPCEIEAVAGKILGVKAVCAIGVPDPRTIEAVKLFVELEDEETEENIDPDTLKATIMAECKANLISYSVPKYIEFRALPINEIGKVDRRMLASETEQKS